MEGGMRYDINAKNKMPLSLLWSKPAFGQGFQTTRDTMFHFFLLCTYLCICRCVYVHTSYILICWELDALVESSRDYASISHVPRSTPMLSMPEVLKLNHEHWFSIDLYISIAPRFKIFEREENARCNQVRNDDSWNCKVILSQHTKSAFWINFSKNKTKESRNWCAHKERSGCA